MRFILKTLRSVLSNSALTWKHPSPLSERFISAISTRSTRDARNILAAKYSRKNPPPPGESILPLCTREIHACHLSHHLHLSKRELSELSSSFRRFSSRGTSTPYCTAPCILQPALPLSGWIAGIFYDKQRCIFATRPRGPPRGIGALPTSNQARTIPRGGGRGRAGRERCKSASTGMLRGGGYSRRRDAHVCVHESRQIRAREKGGPDV